VEFRVLGPLDVVDGARTGTPTGAKERMVLARLLVEPGRSVAADALLEAAWPGEPPERAARSLQVRLAHLRRFLEPDRADGAPSALLPRDGAGYRLAVDPAQVDAVRFARLVGEAGELPPRRALDAYDEALSLWRGTPFPELPDDDAARLETLRLHELLARARLGRARALLELGRHDDALSELRPLEAAEPLSEEVARAVALGLYRAGRQVEALDSLRALGARLRELGLEPGADTQELERLILVHDPDLAGPQPARRGIAFPRPSSSFVGRDAHLAHAADLIRESRLVTIAGVGGAGKTRLALELAALVGDQFAGGPWWCELAPVGADADVVGAVGTALGVESGGVDRIADHIGSQPALLALDNCEHVLAGAGAAVEALLPRCPGLVVLATSRAPLGVDGEHVLRLAGLELPAGSAPDAAQAPAVALFVDRARAAGGALDETSDMGAIAELCRRLDGLPLAIELAAGRTRSLAPREIAARLDERFGLLGVRGRRAAARHTTLREAIDWSFELLDAPQQRLFERLSVFARPCTLADAESVCAGDGVERDEIADLLDDLVANSLVVAAVDGERTRYALLETLRQYGLEKLSARDETARLRDRHTDHYVSAALAIRSQGWRQAMLPFVDEFDDLRAAVRWCMARDERPDRAFVLVEALWWPAPSRHGEEIARLCDEALARWPDPHPWRSRALGAASVARLVAADAAAAHRLAEEAVSLEAPGEEPALLARRTLAQIAFFTGGPARAIELWREQGRLARAAGYPGLGCEADGFTVQLLHAGGSPAEASALARRMRDEADRLGWATMVGWSRYVSGIALIDTDPEQATRWLRDALDQSRAVDHHHMVRFSLRALGIAAVERGDQADASRLLLEALAHDEAVTDAASQWTTLMAAAVALARGGQLEQAAELFAATERWPAARPGDRHGLHEGPVLGGHPRRPHPHLRPLAGRSRAAGVRRPTGTADDHHDHGGTPSATTTDHDDDHNYNDDNHDDHHDNDDRGSSRLEHRGSRRTEPHRMVARWRRGRAARRGRRAGAAGTRKAYRLTS
jgi:predicted ATPase/DNA-binding SARP family transcriptional activator